MHIWLRSLTIILNEGKRFQPGDVPHKVPCLLSLFFSVLLWRDDRGHSQIRRLAKNIIGIIASVGQQMLSRKAVNFINQSFEQSLLYATVAPANEATMCIAPAAPRSVSPGHCRNNLPYGSSNKSAGIS